MQVYRSIVSPGVRINSFALIEDAILFDGVEVGRRTRIRRAIIDKDVRIPANFEIGWNLAADRARDLRSVMTELLFLLRAKNWSGSDK